MRKHWTEYLIVSALGWALYTVLLYASGWGVWALLRALRGAFGPLPIDEPLGVVVGFATSLPFAAGGALALVLVFSYLRWPMDNPYLRAHLEAEAEEQTVA